MLCSPKLHIVTVHKLIEYNHSHTNSIRSDWCLERVGTDVIRAGSRALGVHLECCGPQVTIDNSSLRIWCQQQHWMDKIK